MDPDLRRGEDIGGDMRGGGGGGGGGGGEDIGGESPPAYTCLRELRLASARTFTCAVSRHSFSHLSNSIPLQQCLTLSFFRNSHKLCFSSILHLYELLEMPGDLYSNIFANE